MIGSSIGRPLGEVARAILDQLGALDQEQPPLTLREIAYRGQIGIKATRETISSLKRAGKGQIVGYRRVHYRNRPVAEYRLPNPLEVPEGPVSLSQALACWH
jgi:hypothetical protein